MANRSEKVEFYVTPETKAQIEEAAKTDDKSVSAWCSDRINAVLRGDAVAEKSEELKAEQRLEALVSEATSEVEAAVDDLREMQVQSSIYSVAAWELLKQDVSNIQRQDALSAAASRLQDSDQPEMDLATDVQETPDQTGSEGSGPLAQSSETDSSATKQAESPDQDSEESSDEETAWWNE